MQPHNTGDIPKSPDQITRTTGALDSDSINSTPPNSGWASLTHTRRYVSDHVTPKCPSPKTAQETASQSYCGPTSINGLGSRPEGHAQLPRLSLFVDSSQNWLCLVVYSVAWVCVRKGLFSSSHTPAWIW